MTLVQTFRLLSVTFAATLLVCSPNASAQSSLLSALESRIHSSDLDAALLEVSGLAYAGDGAVYAHNDEHAIVYRINPKTGNISSVFALGDPTVKGDFEGVAALNDRLYLLTSGGYLYEGLIGANGDRIKFNAYDTGVGDFCEAESLTLGPPTESGNPSFLIVCKTAKKISKQELFEPSPQGQKSLSVARKLAVFRWDLGARAPVTKPWLSAELADILNEKELKKFRPSAADWLPKTNALVILSGANAMMIVVNKSGDLLEKENLDSDFHKQAEGLTILPNGDLVIADEGGKRRPAKIQIYSGNVLE